ncbi:endonuclease/exonuclease/phosphatase family protein [Pseudozobellia thermophila]|uniref:Metal-dependent hydrolase, endonuclease/exonuclease/phosphatase family n=1 Tax=Pseudozobellia thermophila TaxID=192903 RepID=A0A1M6N8M0_9FLAO|nr:endonuclease/exonuclease/phosphatase family protein [Pseudozobellia thermophila]SHJ92048.1 Metal-dependent hydrolase, endonuclease/exonuclease/phosphatase family [Pseudozobellia thermophila]
MRRFFIVPLFLLALVGRAQSDTLRVMSFNILHGATVRNDFNLDTIAAVIKSYDPDLVALQEVDVKTRRAKKYDLPTELAYRTGMAPLFARAMYYDGGEYGEAVLSRYSFVETRNVALPHLPDSEPRAAAVVKVRTQKGNTFRFIATHLDHQADEADRIMQAKALVREFGASEYPTLLLGDLNAEPNSGTMAIISEVFKSPDVDGAGEYTYPSSGPHKKIDYILYDRPGHWKVLEYKVLCENYASDHCIVMATLVFRP